MTDKVEARLRALGIELPRPSRPLGAYRAYLIEDNYLHISMQGPVRNGKPVHIGRLGSDLSIDQGREAAVAATLNAVAIMKDALGGFDRIDTILRLDGCIACADDFYDHPAVLDAASELLGSIFEDRAGHIRTVFGVRNLVANLPLAVVVTAKLKAA